eukprot:4554335-Pyramimonas_sp.AAC.1
MMKDTEAEGKRQAEQAEVVTKLAEAPVRVTLRPEEIKVGNVYKGVVVRTDIKRNLTFTIFGTCRHELPHTLVS